uniref:Uncharacterized protein AlNc14C2G240 n=1 Tax=Albugo laibachii Nc14 TaxID=890382 RepID=F0VZ99_9STRA|nr:conserved hypothetical protein [Albugo laibachii Nc14]|eukprot:CCA14129.1 conserved hypothetical protein [Albugo laibachii Nc14]
MVAPSESSESMLQTPKSTHEIEAQKHSQTSKKPVEIDASRYKNLEDQLQLICKDSDTQMYVTPQEALLLKMYDLEETTAPQTEKNPEICSNYSSASHTTANSVQKSSKTNIMPVMIPQERAFMKKATPKGDTTPKTMKLKSIPVSDRERVQNFLAHRQSQSSAGGKTCFAAKTPRSSVKKMVNNLSSSSGSGKRRSNPLADILKSTSLVNTSATAAKRPRRQPERPVPAALRMNYLEPGEIGNKNPEAGFSDEKYIQKQDWDTSDPSSLVINLPQVEFLAKNTVIMQLTILKETDFCISFSQKAAKSDATGKTGTILYQLSFQREEEQPFQQGCIADATKELSSSLDKDLIPFGKSFSLRITVTLNGFALLINQLFAGRFQHQVPIDEGKDLSVAIIPHDAQRITLHRVWWGHAELSSSESNMLLNGSYHSPGKHYLDRGDSNAPYRTPSGNWSNRHTPHPFELFVGNLPHGTSREELSFLFEYLGYETVRITHRGSGFVTLRSAEDMHRAVEHLNGKAFNGRILQVSCALPAKSASNYG